MKRELVFNTECLVDATRYIHLLFYADEAKWVSNVPEFKFKGSTCYITVENDELDLNYFKNVAANIEDGHVMLETMNFGKKPTSRTYETSEFRKKMVKFNALCKR